MSEAECDRVPVTAEELDFLYSGLGLTINECAVNYGLSPGRMNYQFKKLGVKTDFYRRQRREERYNWNGGRSINKYGYIVLCIPNYPGADKRGRVYEHRYVMEQKIGRSLETYEYVHHINGNKNDNRIENLELTTRYKHPSLHTHVANKGMCTVVGCGDTESARGLCKKHYRIAWMNNLIPVKKPWNKGSALKCSVKS